MTFSSIYRIKPPASLFWKQKDRTFDNPIPRFSTFQYQNCLRKPLNSFLETHVGPFLRKCIFFFYEVNCNVELAWFHKNHEKCCFLSFWTYKCDIFMTFYTLFESWGYFLPDQSKNFPFLGFSLGFLCGQVKPLSSNFLNLALTSVVWEL